MKQAPAKVAFKHRKIKFTQIFFRCVSSNSRYKDNIFLTRYVKYNILQIKKSHKTQYVGPSPKTDILQAIMKTD